MGWGAWKKTTEATCDRKVPEKAKGRLNKTMVMLYEMEVVAVTKAKGNKIQVLEMKIPGLPGKPFKPF